MKKRCYIIIYYTRLLSFIIFLNIALIIIKSLYFIIIIRVASFRVFITATCNSRSIVITTNYNSEP